MDNDTEPAEPQGEAAQLRFGFGCAAYLAGALIGILGVALMAFHILPAVILLPIAFALAWWGRKSLNKAEPNVR